MTTSITPEQALKGTLIAVIANSGHPMHMEQEERKTLDRNVLDFIFKHEQLVSLLLKLRENEIKFEFDLISSDVETGKLVLGINTYNWVWSWWTISELGEELYDSFLQSYSMNTGRSKKSLSRSLKVNTELKRTLKVQSDSNYSLLNGF